MHRADKGRIHNGQQLIGRNLPPNTKIVHWSFIQLAKPDGGETTAILCLTTTAFRSEGVSVYIYDGPNGSKDISKEVPPQVMGRVVGETMTDLLKSGVWRMQGGAADEDLIDF